MDTTTIDKTTLEVAAEVGEGVSEVVEAVVALEEGVETPFLVQVLPSKVGESHLAASTIS
jgi:hypothetical protein